jgi:two-component system, NarL family, sensor kinase
MAITQLPRGSISRFKKMKELPICPLVLEHLNNIVKHAQATEAVVQLQMQEQTLTLSIKDDGIGFDPQQVRQGIG